MSPQRCRRLLIRMGRRNKVTSLIPRKIAASYRELEARQKRVQDLEKLYSDMALPKELQ
ncbi:hypothetical protein GW17_00010519, partial [Ensete ventricosum]